MSRFRFAICMTAVFGLNTAASADPTPEQLLAFKPLQKGVDVSRPDPTGCKVELEQGRPVAGGGVATAWVLKDAQGKVVIKLHDTNGKKTVNMRSYYKDGEEIYREMIPDGKQVPDQYRWLGSAGSRWGIDKDLDGRIDVWMSISPEEVTQEVLAAIITKDQKRLEALMITDEDLQLLGVPDKGPEAGRIRNARAAMPNTFNNTLKALARLSEKTEWVQADFKAPHTTPADAIGSTADLVRYRQATVLYQDGKVNDWMQCGELVQVGKAWKVVQAPVAGLNPVVPGGAQIGDGLVIPEGAEPIVRELENHDKKVVAPGPQGSIDHHLGRAAILEKIIALGKKPEVRAPWIRQAVESFSAAAQNQHEPAAKRLTQWREKLIQEDAGQAIIAFVRFRELSAEYSIQLPTVGRDSEKLIQFQTAWKDKLGKFVADYPTAEDAPDALAQIGMVNEFLGPKHEADAKAAYTQLVRKFGNHMLAKRAQGCLDRMALEGNQLDLIAPTLDGKARLDVKQLRGKAVVVYYWASQSGEAAVADFARLRAAMAPYANKVELIGVCLDREAKDGLAFLQARKLDGTHLFEPGGSESPLAVRYGIAVLPVTFVVGPDGKVVNRAAQPTTVDEDLKKVLKDK